MIVAVDFDGILCENAFPDIGAPHYNMVAAIREIIDAGHEVVLWTSRVEKELEAAVGWCEDYGLHFCAINENAPSNREKFASLYKVRPRKIYADVYIDDHNPAFKRAADSHGVGQAISMTINQLRRITNVKR